MMLRDVRHVPYLRFNLMSRISLAKEDFQNYFGNDRWKITKGMMVVARREICYMLYMTLGKISKNGLNVATDSSPSLWNRVLAT